VSKHVEREGEKDSKENERETKEGGKRMDVEQS
jgi:hypothetical protein